ncbi:hypothetical protein CHUAL_002693 [Chamberlinius hualienensis]
MDDKYKESLFLHRAKFVQFVDVDLLFPYLLAVGILSENEIDQLRNETNQNVKAEKFLDLLPSKGDLGFRSLCIALESTYPHLLTVMFLGVGNKISDSASVMSSNGSVTDSVVDQSSRMEPDQAITSCTPILHSFSASPLPMFSRESYELHGENKPLLHKSTESKMTSHDNRDSMRMDMHKVDAQLRRLPAVDNSLVKHGGGGGGGGGSSASSSFDKDISSSDKSTISNRDYERIKAQCESAMRELQLLRRQNNEATRRYDNAFKECEFYRMQHKLVLSKLDQHQNEALTLKAQCNEVLADKHRLEQEVTNLQKFREEDRKEVSDLRRQQQEVMDENGSSEAINQMYIAALRKYEAVKDDYDSFRKRYADLIVSHSSATNKLELTQEENARLKKQLEEVVQERNGAIRERNGLKQQCTAAIRQWDSALRERNEAKEALTKVQQQRDEAMKEINQAMAVRIKAAKDLARLTEERNAAVQEYSLIMSERDSVHKEIEKLQEELVEAAAKIKTLDNQKKISYEEVETLRREIASALHDRDKTIKQCHELREKYEDYETGLGDGANELNEITKDYEYYRRERELNLKSRSDIHDHSNIMDNYCKTQKKETVENLEQANQEIDKLRKQLEKLQTEFSDIVQEADVAKRRRDWAFSERDKIVQERESIRTLCDKLRRERDRAVSDLAEALRDSDDIKKQRNEASKELKELREKIETQIEKESRLKHLNSIGHNHSRDSAIDSDMQEWEIEILEIEISSANADFGFELSGGRDDPHCPESAIVVSSILKGGAADGKLKINDCVLKINSIDVTNADRRMALDTIKSRRRLTSSRLFQAVHLNLSGGKEHGLSLENGVYINRIAPDHVRSGAEATRLLDIGGETLVLSVLKSVSHSAPLSSSSSGHNIQDNMDSDKNSVLKSYNGSPTKDNYRSNGKEHAKKLITSSSQTDECSLGHSSQRVVLKKSSDEPGINSNNSSTQILLDKLLRERKDKRNDWYSYFQEEEAALAKLDSVIKTASSSKTKSKKKRVKESEKNGGTWPKYRGPPLEVMECCPGTMTQVHRKKERVSLAALLTNPKHQSSFYEGKKCLDREHERDRVRERREIEIELIDRVVEDHRLVVEVIDYQIVIDVLFLFIRLIMEEPVMQQINSTGNFSKSSFQSPNSGLGSDSKSGSQANYSASSSMEFNLDFSVVSANRDKEVLDKYYKNKKSRPKSAIYLQTDSENFSPSDGSLPNRQTSLDGPMTSLYKQPLMDHLSDPMNLSPHMSPRISAVHERIASQPSYISSSVNHSAPLHTSGHIPSYYSSGESLLSGSIPESSFHDSRSFPRYVGNPSPSPSSFNYNSSCGYSHSPPHSTDTHFHPISKRPPHNYPSSSPATAVAVPTTYRSGELIGFSSSDGPSTIPKRKGYRIRIPSNQSVTSAGKMSTSSIERASTSDRNSPMPAFHVETITASGSIVQRSISDFRNTKPSPGELRTIRINKTSEETLGIQIDCGPRGGIFVSSVSENSLAAQAGIHIGDQLLEVCGINMRSATYLLAANVLRQCGDSITMLVQFNPEKYREGHDSSETSSSDGSPIQTPTPQSSPKSSRNVGNLIDVDDGLPASATSTLKRQNTLVSSSNKESQVGGGDIYAPRYVFLKMQTANLGITFLGGNAVGIFVHKYNGVDLRHATAEQAAYELAKRADTITLLVQYSIDRYNEIQHLPGDSFYIRTMFEHQTENPNELSFRKDDILYVDNTMFNGVAGLWRAWIVDEEGHKKQCGVISSKYKVEEDFLLRRSLGDLDSETGSRRGVSSSRRSFFRRNRKHQRSNSRDSKELASFSDVSINSYSDSGTLIEDPPILTYQRVERFADVTLRPVLLLGPLVDTILDKLIQDYPRRLVRCVPEVMDASPMTMEQGVQDNIYIDYRRRGNSFECNTHCIIDVSPAGVERLHRNQIYPIVIFIKFKSTKQIRELKDPRNQLEKVTTKAAKEMYEHSLRVESEYKHLTSAVIQGGNLALMSSQIRTQIDQLQHKAVWVPVGSI